MKNETVLEPCEGCERLYDDEVICTHDLGLCPDCQKLDIYVACCSCGATLNIEDGEAIAVAWCEDRRSKVLSPIKNATMCDACNDYANQPFEMDWQGFD